MDLSAFPYLQGNYAPVTEERDFDESELRIEGKIPESLTGWNWRNRKPTRWRQCCLPAEPLRVSAGR